MRLARYADDAGVRSGIVVDDRIVDLASVTPFASGIVDVLAEGPEAWKGLEWDASRCEGPALRDVRLLAPIARPGKFLALGMNSTDHVEEALSAPKTPDLVRMLEAFEHVQAAFPSPRFPLVFNKQVGCITGPTDNIWVPHDAPEIDYEGEAVIVIGRRARRLDPHEAVASIAGWTITNDVSVRDWQWDTSQLWLGKSFDTHGPLGPWITTADSVDIQESVIRTWLNGELRQEGRIGDQVMQAAAIVSMLSQVCTLEPGDLIATGTPGGTGGVFGRWLRPGDDVRISVSGVGEINNHVIAEPTTTSTGEPLVPAR